MDEEAKRQIKRLKKRIRKLEARIEALESSYWVSSSYTSGTVTPLPDFDAHASWREMTADYERGPRWYEEDDMNIGMTRYL
jgi:hypothetical protein